LPLNRHEINHPIPLILYKTHAEFEQTNLFPSFLPEEVYFAESARPHGAAHR
jgi:hypothetical protein